MLRKTMAMAVVVLAWLGSNRVNANTLNLAFSGVNPTGTVKLGGINTEDVYAGVINWTNLDTSATQYTYCIDISHNLFSPGDFTTESLSNSNLSLTAPEIQAIQNLFYDHSAPAEPTGPGNIDTTGPLNISPNPGVLAAEFQVALWDAIYNWSGGVHVDNLTFADDGSGQLNASEIAIAQGWASAAYSGTLTRGANENVEGLYDATNQNQAAYLGVITNTPAVPTPSAAFGGFVLLGVVGVARYRRRRHEI